MATRMFQVGYLQRRRPELTPEQFRARWRDHHHVAAACSGFWAPVHRYVQNDVLPDPASSFDAVGELFYSSREAWIAAMREPHDSVFEDADTFFAIRPNEHLFGGEVDHLGGVTAADFKLMVFFVRSPGVAYEAYEQVIREVGATAARFGIGAAFAGIADRDLTFEANLRVWFERSADAGALLSDPDWHAAMYEATTVIDPARSLVLTARENVLQTA